MKTVKEIMKTQPQSVVKNENLKNAAAQMGKSNIGFLPVVDENQKVIGTITDRDITLAIGKSNKTAQEIKVHEVMKSPIHSIKPEDDAASALKVMRTKKVGRLPVVDSENRLKGIVSLMGITRKVKISNELTDLENKGNENIVSTLHALAQRNSKVEIEEPAEE
ncbi:MAG TPA: CBS domain-containing protein [Bacteroidia bacterium]|jgi:CBS domain-containing protein|nr:CBS domain-containing protein [Bacteroidia bacterium]